MTAMRRLLLVETKLLTRDVGVLVFGLAFPALLLAVLATVFPGFLDPDPELGGLRLIDAYTPVMLVFVFVMVGVQSVPATLAGYRQSGVLRRLRTTPVGPSRLLVAHLVAYLGIAVVGVAAAILVAVTVFDVAPPASWAGLVVAALLAAASLFAVGLLIGALAPSSSSAPAIGTFVWLPLMVLAGLWLPREAMPEGMRTVSDYSPGGAAVEALQQAWYSGTVPGSSLAVMAVSAVVVGVAAAATFRWE